MSITGLPMQTLAKFFQLLKQAERAGAAVDEADDASRGQWNALVGAQRAACVELVEFVAANAERVKADLNEAAAAVFRRDEG